jgi:hypothetical protein
MCCSFWCACQTLRSNYRTQYAIQVRARRVEQAACAGEDPLGRAMECVTAARAREVADPLRRRAAGTLMHRPARSP